MLRSFASPPPKTLFLHNDRKRSLRLDHYPVEERTNCLPNPALDNGTIIRDWLNKLTSKTYRGRLYSGTSRVIVSAMMHFVSHVEHMWTVKSTVTPRSSTPDEVPVETRAKYCRSRIMDIYDKRENNTYPQSCHLASCTPAKSNFKTRKMYVGPMIAKKFWVNTWRSGPSCSKTDYQVDPSTVVRV